MAVSLNTQHMSVNDGGAVSFSGLTSNIDWQSAVNSIAKAKQARLTSITDRINQNTSKIKALGEFGSLATALNTSIQSLYGKVTADKSYDVFESKTIQASTTRQAGESGAASQATELIGASVANTAAAGNYDLEILQVAKAAKIRSDVVVDPNSALGMAGNVSLGGVRQQQVYDQTTLSQRLAEHGELDLTLDVAGRTVTYAAAATDIGQWAAAFNASSQAADSGFRAGVVGNQFVIWSTSQSSRQATISLRSGVPATTIASIKKTAGTDPATIVVAANDTLQDVRAKINAASQRSGSAALASVISVSPGESYLVLNGGSVGEDIHLADASGELRGANFLGLFGMPSSQTIGNITDATAVTGVRLAILRPGVDSIDATTFDTTGEMDGLGLAARLQNALRTADGGRDDLSVAFLDGALTVTDRRGGTIDQVGVTGPGDVQAFAPSATRPLVIQRAQKMQLNFDGQGIERQTNEVNDIVDGLSLQIVKSEPGTKININIEQDSYNIAKQIKSFVDAYNGMLDFIGRQTAFDPNTGQIKADAVLARSSSLRGLQSFLVSTIGGQAYGDAVNGRVRTLPDIGITIDNSQTDDQTGKIKGMLTLDENKLITAINQSPEAVRRMFAFVAEATDPKLSIIGFTAKSVKSVRGGSGLLTFSFTPAAVGRSESYSFSEADNQCDVVRSGNAFTVKSGSAQGLTFYLSDLTTPISSSIAIGVGTAAGLYGQLTSLVQADSGDIASELSLLQDSNSAMQKRVDDAQVRIDRQKQLLLAKYQRMEAALAQMNSVRQSMTATFDALTNNK